MGGVLRLMSKPVKTPAQMSRSALERETRPAATARSISVPITTRKNAQGLEELVHGDTGDVLGICASPAQAERTKGFLK